MTADRDTIARVLGYLFGSGFGWFAASQGVPLWATLLVGIVAGLLATAIINALRRKLLPAPPNA